MRKRIKQKSENARRKFKPRVEKRKYHEFQERGIFLDLLVAGGGSRPNADGHGRSPLLYGFLQTKRNEPMRAKQKRENPVKNAESLRRPPITIATTHPRNDVNKELIPNMETERKLGKRRRRLIGRELKRIEGLRMLIGWKREVRCCETRKSRRMNEVHS